jgi:hypothetical protein
MKQIAAFPIVTYVFSFTGPSSLNDIFATCGCRCGECGYLGGEVSTG